MVLEGSHRTCILFYALVLAHMMKMKTPQNIKAHVPNSPQSAYLNEQVGAVPCRRPSTQPRLDRGLVPQRLAGEHFGCLVWMQISSV